MHWHLSIRTSIKVFNNLSYSSLCIGSDLQSLIHHRFILGPLLTDTDHCTWRTSHKSWDFEGAVTQSTSHQSLALVKLSQILNAYTSTLRTRCWLFADLPRYRCHDEEIISVVYFVIMLAWLVYKECQEWFSAEVLIWWKSINLDGLNLCLYRTVTHISQ